MKKEIHPQNYRLVIFRDMSNGFSFLSKSTAESSENVEWEDGKEYPLVKLEISYKSHPYFTGKMQFVDTAGRIDKFKNKYAKWDKPGAKAESKPSESAKAENTDEKPASNPEEKPSEENQ